MSELTQSILTNLVSHEEYSRAVLPHLKAEYFDDVKERIIFTKIAEHVSKFNVLPSQEALAISLENSTNLAGKEFTEIKPLLPKVFSGKVENFDFLYERTENFCKEKAVYLAIVKSIDIVDGKKNESPDAIPKILQDALGVCFDTSVGHDYLDDFSARYDFYHKKEHKIPFDIEILNKITKDGLAKKSLNIVAGPIGKGKSLVMCHLAASQLLKGRNVLYITLEMPEEMIAQRIDANLLDVTLDNLVMLSKEKFESKVEALRNTTVGKLVIKEYAPTTASVATFRHLLAELKTKRNFIPEIIVVDYLNLCASTRMKAADHTYSYVKSLAEELRGLAVEENVVMFSATQINKASQNSTDFGIEDIAESNGLAATCDLLLGFMSTDELDNQGLLMFKQLKNRYAAAHEMRTFMIGVDKSKMRLFDVKQQSRGFEQDDGGAPSGKRLPVLDAMDQLYSNNKKPGGKAGFGDFTF